MNTFVIFRNKAQLHPNILFKVLHSTHSKQYYVFLVIAVTEFDGFVIIIHQFINVEKRNLN